jgi:hypothetical protein
LLETATSASEKVAVLHLGFMAVCAYLLVIVFGHHASGFDTEKTWELNRVHSEYFS